MEKTLISIGLVLTAILFQVQSLKTVNSHLTASDWKRLEKVFEDNINSNDLQSVYYSSLNHKSINNEIKQSVCKRLKQLHTESKLNDFEKNFYLIGTNKQLKCAEDIPQDILKQVTLTKAFGTAHEIFFNLFAAKALGTQIDKNTSDKIAKSLQEILKKDDSLSSLGYSFYVGAELGNAASFVVDRVEDAISQADEVNGRMLQFEGGLSITALIVNGAFKITKAYNKPSPINQEQAVKLATYFLSRRSVQTAKGAHVLIEALKTLSTSNKEITPICIQIIGNGQLQTESPILNIKVVNLLGNPITPPIDKMSGKIYAKKDNAVLAENLVLISKSSDKTVYSTDLAIYKPTRDIYIIDIKADAYEQTLTFKVLGKVKIQSIDIGIGDSDAASALKKQFVIYPSKLDKILQADHTQKLVLKFVLIDESTSKIISVHQAFVRLANIETDDEIIFVAEQDTSKSYKFDMDVGARSADFGHKSGQYKIELIIGDASISNSFKWNMADIQLKFAQEPKKEQSTTIKSRQPLPEIVHKFREPEKRPPRIVSDIFTGLCLTPLVLLLILWTRLGVNIRNFTLNLSTIGFHAGFGAILTLFAVFWLQLNMFETIRYLLPIALLTFLCGNKLLRSIAARKTAVTPSS